MNELFINHKQLSKELIGILAVILGTVLVVKSWVLPHFETLMVLRERTESQEREMAPGPDSEKVVDLLKVRLARIQLVRDKMEARQTVIQPGELSSLLYKGARVSRVDIRQFAGREGGGRRWFLRISGPTGNLTTFLHHLEGLGSTVFIEEVVLQRGDPTMMEIRFEVKP